MDTVAVTDSSIGPEPPPLDEALPKAEVTSLDLAWNEFRRQDAKGATRVWRIAILPDGETFRVQEGILGQTLREYDHRKGPQGRPSSPTYLTAQRTCQNEVSARILKRRHGEMWHELINGALEKAGAFEINFSESFPRTVRTSKPAHFITKSEFLKLKDDGLARVTRKYDGIGLIIVNHTYGWQIYTLMGNQITSMFPNHVEELQKTEWGVGTVLKGEAVMFIPGRLKEDFNLMNAVFKPIRKPEAIRAQIDSGAVPDATIVLYDALYISGKDLAQDSYDKRAEHWRRFPDADSGSGLIRAATLYDSVTPSNWLDMRDQFGFEGFVVVDGSSILGKGSISFSEEAPRPKGAYKLKPNFEEDVVAYAVRKRDKDDLESREYESLYIKQVYPQKYPNTDIDHPSAGEWFSAGRVSLHGSPEARELVHQLVLAKKLEVVDDDKIGHAIPVDNDHGVTVVIEVFAREKSDKFRLGKLVRPFRFRTEDSFDYKPTVECVAQRPYNPFLQDQEQSTAR